MDKPKWIVADVETTGLDPTIDKIVEVGWYEVDSDLGFVPGTEFSTLVNPNMHVSCGAAGVNGCRDSVIASENPPTIDEVEFPRGPVILVCHNIKFDYQFLKDHLDIVDTLCTLVLARRLIPGSDNYKLSTLSCHLDLPMQLSHRTKGDVLDCANLLIRMCEELDITLDEMLAYSKEEIILTYCRVGAKWNGHLWSEVDKGYLNWILRNDFDADSIRAAKYWLRG